MAADVLSDETDAKGGIPKRGRMHRPGLLIEALQWRQPGHGVQQVARAKHRAVRHPRRHRASLFKAFDAAEPTANWTQNCTPPNEKGPHSPFVEPHSNFNAEIGLDQIETHNLVGPLHNAFRQREADTKIAEIGGPRPPHPTP